MNTTPRRDPFGIVIAIMFLISAATLAALALVVGGWWNVAWPFAVILALLGITGLAEDVPKRRRDDRGHPIRTRRPRRNQRKGQ